MVAGRQQAWAAWVILLVVVLWPALAGAQGVLIIVDPDQPVRLPRPIYPPPFVPPHHPPHVPPLPPTSYSVSQLEADVRLTDQVARVQMSQSFVNTGSRPLEASFVFPLPYDGAIEQMTLLVDGKEHPARLLNAEEARRIYEDIVRRNRDPALLEWVGTGMFKTSVFPVPPGAKRTVSLRYTQLCRQSQGLVDLILPLSTAKYTARPVEEISIRVSIDSPDDLKNVYSPTHAVDIKRGGPRQATVTYRARQEIPASDFRLFYDVGRGRVSTRVLSYRPDRNDDGYFLLLASPEIKGGGALPRKTVVFAVDRSGSMSGKKIEQVRGALAFALNNLRPGDLFNIVTYDSQIEAFRPELQRFDDDSRKAALAFVEGLYAGGSTNIDGALARAFSMFQDDKQPGYLFFLTDGRPTVGETNEMQIVARAKENNRRRTRLFAFGVGYDLNSRLLDKLVRNAWGQSEYVAPDEDIEARISRLVHRIDTPVMTDVKLEFDLDVAGTAGRVVNRLYPQGAFDLFAGEQLVIVGRYKTPGKAKVTVSGRVGEQTERFNFPVELVDKSPDDGLAFVQKLWAVRRVGEILDEIDLHGKNSELIQELTELSKRHGILTPYTSFLADERTSLTDLTTNTRRASERVDALRVTDGYSGVAQRSLKNALQQAQNAPSAGGGMAWGFGAAPATAKPLDAAALSSRVATAGRPAPGIAGAMGGMGGAQAVQGWGADAEREAAAAESSVRNVGGRAFYRRNGQWVDATLTADQQAKPRHLKQFSDDYFELARRHGRQFTQYAAFEEPTLVNVEGAAYLIEP